MVMQDPPTAEARTAPVGSPRMIPSGANCANCDEPLEHVFADLGWQPLCESFVPPERATSGEGFYPLIAYVCSRCFLVQVPPVIDPVEIFTDYAYFSSYSDSWLDHASRYVDKMVDELGLTRESFVVELASNDGYLLRGFVDREIPCLGIEPAQNVAAVAQERGVPTLAEFFTTELGEKLANEGKRADLMIGNNVLAQVPTIHDFIGGVPALLAPEGVLTLEFPHLIQLMDGNQFDTIYHEHFFYFSLNAVSSILEQHGLRVFDVEELPTHGGSLRIYACHSDSTEHPEQDRVAALAERERDYGLLDLDRYASFQQQVVELKRSILDFLIERKRSGEQIVAYGAPGKGNTLLNYCGIRTDFLDYAVDRSPVKQGWYTPGTHIPILDPEELKRTQPDWVVIAPWNIKDEITSLHSYIESWGGRFVIFLPEVLVYRDGEWVRPEAMGS